MTPVTADHLTIPFAELEVEGERTWTEFKNLLAEIPGMAELPTSRILLELPLATCKQNLYCYFPFIFQDGFPAITVKQLRQLSVAAVLLLQHCLLTDRLVDRDPEAAPSATTLFANQGTLLWAWKWLDAAAGPKQVPWNELLACYQEFGQALVRESQEHTGRPSAYSSDDLIQILGRKSAPAKIISTLMCHLGDR